MAHLTNMQHGPPVHVLGVDEVEGGELETDLGGEGGVVGTPPEEGRRRGRHLGEEEVDVVGVEVTSP